MVLPPSRQGCMYRSSHVLQVRISGCPSLEQQCSVTMLLLCSCESQAVERSCTSRKSLCNVRHWRCDHAGAAADGAQLVQRTAPVSPDEPSSAAWCWSHAGGTASAHTMRGAAQVLLPAARERLARIALVKPDKARGVEDLVLQAAQRGQIVERVRAGRPSLQIRFCLPPTLPNSLVPEAGRGGAARLAAARTEWGRGLRVPSSLTLDYRLQTATANSLLPSQTRVPGRCRRSGLFRCWSRSMHRAAGVRSRG